MTYRPIADMWMLARPKVKYYGAYPNGFLPRARTLIGCGPDDAVLHVCGGKTKDYPGSGFGKHDMTLDLDPDLDPDYLQDANAPYPNELWDGVLADPPYDLKEAENYKPGSAVLPTPGRILRNALDVLPVGGKVGILAWYPPQPTKNSKCIAEVGVIVGFNNRIRCFSVYEKLESESK